MKSGLLYALITAILFATLEPVSKMIVSEVNPYAITFWRFLIGSLILLPPALIKIRKDKIRLSGKDLILAACLGTLFVCISMLALQIGVEKADTPALIAVVFSANSVFTILFACFILREKLNRNKVMALVFGAAGVLISADLTSATNLQSLLYGVFAALSFSLYTVLSQKYLKRIVGVVQTGLTFLMGSIVLFLVLLIMRVDLLPAVSVKTVSVLCYLGVLVTGIGYWSFFEAVRKGGSLMGSLAFFIKPILTPFVTFFVNGIVPDLRILAAIGCVTVASYFAAYRKTGVRT